MARSTALDLITASLKDIGVLAATETAPAGDAADALDSLNALIDQWKAERLQIFTVTRTTWTISASDGEYTVGTGANVNVDRPVFVDHVNYIETSTTPDTETSLIALTEAAYAGIQQKALTATYPTHYYYNPTFSSGLATLTLWPTPTATTLTGALYAPTPLAELAALSTAFSLPPGYERMIVKNLALELVPSYGKVADPVLVRQAMDSMAVVKRANFRLADLSFGSDVPGMRGGYYDVQTGQ